MSWGLDFLTSNVENFLMSWLAANCGKRLKSILYLYGKLVFESTYNKLKLNYAAAFPRAGRIQYIYETWVYYDTPENKLIVITMIAQHKLKTVLLSLFLRQGKRKTMVLKFKGVYANPTIRNGSLLQLRQLVNFNWLPFMIGLSYRPLDCAIFINTLKIRFNLICT